jgi:hypothetical protein
MSPELRFKDAGAKVEVNERAAVVGAAEMFIAAPIGTVWSILGDIGNWPRWNASISKMKLDGPVRTGTSFYWASGASRIASCLEEVEPPRRIAWSGRTMGIRAIHVYELDEEKAGTRVRTRESFEGLVARLMRKKLKKMLDKDLADGLGALRAAAERQAPAGTTCKEDAFPMGQPH